MICFRSAFRQFSTQNPLSVKQLRKTLASHLEALKDAPAIENAAKLSPRKIECSRDKVILPLSSDPKLKNEYMNFLGNVRFGLILEDLDTFSVWLSYRHNHGGDITSGVKNHGLMAIVTACVDRIDLHKNFIPCDKDISLEGNVSWVGRSSLETTMRLQQEQSPGRWEPIIEAKFVMVAKNPITNRTVPMHPLLTETNEEIEMFKLGERSKNVRQEETQVSLLKIPPNSEESIHLHELFLRTIDEQSHTFKHRILPSGYVWMENCKLKNVIVCFPQQRNLYNKLFGGYIMRKAFELAWANASAFSLTRPATLAVDDIMFRKPVEIGSLLYLSSEMCYTKRSLMEVRVHAQVVDPEKNTQETTNTFHFTFESEDGRPVRNVMPRTYAENMLYLSGRRHLEETAKKHKINSNMSK